MVERRKLLREGTLEKITEVKPIIELSHAHLPKGSRKGEQREIFKGLSTTLLIHIEEGIERRAEQEYKGLVLSDSIGSRVLVYQDQETNRTQIYDETLDRWYK